MCLSPDSWGVVNNGVTFRRGYRDDRLEAVGPWIPVENPANSSDLHC